MSLKYMTADDHNAIKVVEDYHSLRSIAERVITRIGPPVGMVCGPLSTGGLGSLDANRTHFAEVIRQLESKGFRIFNQLPFEVGIAKLHTPGPDGYDWNILYDFYQPIFDGGLVGKKYFIPGWESSTGACWERQQARENNIEVIDL